MSNLASLSSSVTKEACRICGADARRAYSALPGYQEPETYDIMACDGCGVSYALPMVVDDRVYDLIYRNSWKTPGYDVYHVFADEVLSVDDPLSYLETASSVYWAVGRYLKEISKEKGTRILDFGCGMGYLTYAIAKRGHQVKGLDVSPVAVDKAIRRYGELFLCGNILDRVPDHIGTFEVILCIGMIEHVVDPVALVGSLRNLLTENGELILTTPNKSSFPSEAVWETDNPPIHLWWFTQNAVDKMALNAGYSRVRFVDLAEGPEGRVELIGSRDYSQPICQHIYNRNGKLIFKGHRQYLFRLMARRVTRRMGLLSTALRIKKTLFGTASSSSKELLGHANIWAIFTK